MTVPSQYSVIDDAVYGTDISKTKYPFRVNTDKDKFTDPKTSQEYKIIKTVLLRSLKIKRALYELQIS